MMDHLIDTDLSHEIDALWLTSQSVQLIYKIRNGCQSWELMAARRAFYLKAPSWISRSLIIYDRVCNEFDNYTDLFSTNLTADLQRSLYVELSDIYRGLCCQQNSVSCANLPMLATNPLSPNRHC